MTLLKHILAIALLAAMLFMGLQKFGADNYIFATIAQKSGFAFFEPGFRMFSGVLEVLAGILMFHPRTRGAGAVLASGIVAGAVVFHLSPWLGTKVAMAAGAEPSYSLFTMALAYLVLALINLFLNRQSIPFIGRHLP
ncbi:hypothetical protein [Granulosicoccus antarcticus]|uniref:DoxX family protein n=1 Tax=Granulosicoccus antarcticus IMCC3135 TaxID=1192854 RepID=A0A2Z2NU31_9GAMM|nr:hypothetical protein [Granulosicoccus antarcticus]ASJ73551.1 hypothetical protein IMCC3135_17345 [Granulosicoccus antarcticus IMCC3135]